MKVGVVGSRKYPDKGDVVSFVKNVLLEFENDVELVSGGAEGVDRWIRGVSRRENVELKEFLPDFKDDPDREYDVRDYHRRNRRIAEYCDVVFAFQYNDSKGTRSTINLCREVGTPVFVYRYKTEGVA